MSFSQPGEPINFPIPRGIIVMWSGSISNIPSGWLLCNGTNGTPNLSDRFVLGTINDAEIGNTGGSNSIVLTEPQLPPHAHEGTTSFAPPHRHSNSIAIVAGNHNHQYNESVYSPPDHFFDDGPFPVTVASKPANTSTAGAHNHDLFITNDGVHDHSFTTDIVGSGDPIDIRNPFFKLAFIMKA